MKMRMQTFGEIEVEGERYDYDLVIEQGGIRESGKKPSKPESVAGAAPLATQGPPVEGVGQFRAARRRKPR